VRPSVWNSSLEQFRDDVASTKPVPASVCVSAVCATFALGLLIKVLEITANKTGFTGDLGKVQALLGAARTASARVAQYADEDVTAFDSYLNIVRSPKSNDKEREDRKRAMALALDQVIQVPFDAARLVASGMDLCAAATGVVPKSLIAEVGAAAVLLAGAARGLIVSAEFNLRQLGDDSHSDDEITAQLQDLDRKVLRQEDSIRQQVASLIAGKDG
jgi:formiminotetrahydrofolate cyclodeaminase